MLVYYISVYFLFLISHHIGILGSYRWSYGASPCKYQYIGCWRSLCRVSIVQIIIGSIARWYMIFKCEVNYNYGITFKMLTCYPDTHVSASPISRPQWQFSCTVLYAQLHNTLQYIYTFHDFFHPELKFIKRRNELMNQTFVDIWKCLNFVGMKYACFSFCLFGT